MYVRVLRRDMNEYTLRGRVDDPDFDRSVREVLPQFAVDLIGRVGSEMISTASKVRLEDNLHEARWHERR
jgi:hypothetical protein